MITDTVAEQVRLQRPGLDVRVAFCEKNSPNLRDVLRTVPGPAVVTPLLLASAYHARVDIPAMIDEAGADVLQADTLVRTRVWSRSCGNAWPTSTSAIMTASWASWWWRWEPPAQANARTATLAETLAESTRWAGVQVGYASGPHPW